MLEAGGDGTEGSRWHVDARECNVAASGVPVAPAPDGAVGADGARMLPASADGGDSTGRGLRLTPPVVAPTHNSAVGADGAGMIHASGDGSEGSRRRVRLTDVVAAQVLVISPADDSAVGAKCARMVPAGGDRGEGSRGNVQLPVGVVAPADNGAVSAECAEMIRAGSDGDERVGGRRRPNRSGRCCGLGCLLDRGIGGGAFSIEVRVDPRRGGPGGQWFGLWDTREGIRRFS